LLPKQKKEIERMYNAFVEANKNASSLNELKARKTLVEKNVL
jgi:hypothetical protein